MQLTQRRATMEDLPTLLALLSDDELGANRESLTADKLARYQQAMQRINADANQYLMVVEAAGAIVGTCHLTLMPSLTYQGSMRLQIEAVRVAATHRNGGIGQWMLAQTIAYAKEHDASIVQLTTNKQRHDAQRFYEKLGFQATHEGLKLFLG